MSKIKAKIIADSLSPQGDRLTTFVVTFPRIILSEFNTHRMFSRNSASSRAIPFKKMVEMVEEDPFIPIAWQKDHKGMQGSEYFTEKVNVETTDLGDLKLAWLEARDYAVKQSTWLNKVGVTKQLCNRLLEPFMWHTVIVTSGKEGLENFFNLRCPQYVIKWRENIAGSYGTDAPMKIISRQEVFKSKGEIANYRIKHNLKSALSQYITVENKKDVYYISEEKSLLRRLQVNTSQAEIHIQALAEAMWDSYNESTPKQLKAGEWHIPFYNTSDKEGPSGWIEYCNNNPQVDYHNTDLFTEWRIKVAVARCARVSYTVVGEEGKEPNYEADIKLHDRLLASGHESPMEHIAQAQLNSENYYNLKGFKSYRFLLHQS